MQIETERLLLREYVEDDWRAVLAYQAKSDYGAYYDVPSYDEAYARAFVGRFVRWQGDSPRRFYQMAVQLKGDKTCIGSAGLRLGGIEQLETPVDPHEGVIGYELDPAHRGFGYATEAGRALLEFAFDSLGLHRVWSYHIAANAPSEAVLLRLGLAREGLLRENEFMRGRWADTCIHGILAGEWRRSRAAEEGRTA